jgi:hypothetical protein
MYVEAIKWTMGLVDANVTPRPIPGLSGDVQTRKEICRARNAMSEFVDGAA